MLAVKCIYEVDFSTMLLKSDVCGDDEFAVTGMGCVEVED